MTAIILAGIYVISVIAAYKATRAWHRKNEIDPVMGDVVFVLLPFINVVVAIHYGANLSDGRYAKKFFRMNEDKKVRRR